jgi:mannosyltransferase OCH1-like enzyme
MEKVVNGFWYGPELGELEKLCIDSWIKNGYEFYLWVYDLDIEVPDKVVIANANHIVSFTEYFTYSEGHSRGTPVAFSNLFRAQLLYQRGGLYIDLDVLCLKPYEFNEQFVFSEQMDSGWDYHVATCILYSENKGERIFEDWSDWIITKKNKTITHGDLGPNLFTKLITLYNLKEYVLPKEYFCPVDWQSYKDILEYKPDSYGLHLYRSLWNQKDLKKLINRYLYL